ncbi:uncharacterized protein LOC105225341 [Bactrocera dorsalis]|uniref:Uncharacterized protein LOC105225341 n=1 Tax=Bactrocera dorsalis TaxID=27457 RepID=A0ABM3J0E8_BACDO|nr:uncharacterized protein LOC105225341 [Bactrocera dorsalis]
MSTLAATAQRPGVAKSKTLVGNVASNATTATTTTASTTTTTIITARTTRVTTKLSNQDNHNEYVAANAAQAKHLRHATLGNFNQQNEQRPAKRQQQQHHQPLRLSAEMNDVNNMCGITATTTTTPTVMLHEMNDVSRCKRILSNNNSCCRADNYIKWNYERQALESDNESAPHTRLHKQPARYHMRRATTVCTTPRVGALSAPEISTRVSALPAALDSRQANGTKTRTIAQQQHLALTAAVLIAEPGLKSASGSKSTNSVGAASDALAGEGRVCKPIMCNKKRHLNARIGKHRRKHCKRKRRCHSPTDSVRTEMAHTKGAVRTRAIRCATKSPKALNSGVLTSFLLNSTLLALCNATAATALSAVAATLGETINSSMAAEPPPLAPAASSVGSAYENVSATNGNGSHGGSQIAFPNGGTSDISFNDSDIMLDEDDREYIFDRTDVRIIFITLYSLVFCCCFFGNLLVILVVTLSRRLRSITNFFLANLALADFCVGLFCVMQNLSIYLIESWVFGEFLCRMYQFVHSLSYTASIFILVVICMERYFAIVHPITCKQILTATRLRNAFSSIYSARSRSYRGDSNFNALLTPLTFLVTYFNSGINPLLYAFLSRNFRKGMKELLMCSWKKGKGKSSSNSSMHHKRVALQTHSLPTDTTHIGNEQL